MTAYEILLSESQERMLMVLKPGAEAKARAVFEKWELDFAVVGRLTETGHWVARKDGRIAADIPLEALVEGSPVYERPWTPTPPPAPIAIPQVATKPLEALLKMIGSADLSSRRFIWEQYDHTVMADTVEKPGGDAAVVRVHGTNRGLAVTADCTPRYCKADPKAGGAQAVAEAWRNLTAVGARPLAVTDCMNFGNPERPEIMGQFAGCVEGMAEACRALDFPVVSGNVSLYNETSGQAILPTPQIGAVGLIDDLSVRARAAFGAEGETIVLVGEGRGHLGQSLWLREVAGLEAGPPPPVELAVERKIGDFVRGLIRDGLAHSCHDLSDGGLLVALAEMALASGLGCEVALPAGAEANGFWFGEDQGRYLVALPPAGAEALLGRARTAGVPALTLGKVGGDALTLAGGDHISLGALREAHEGFLPRWMAGEDR